ncbi:globin domain-containing protein [Emticicia sp. SJ17W-69]|uniref:globin domain-containing protein n=1 Tax=Emticicia sp. SJ17W-69 TaxID=3421657 RepID=UPI003EBE4E7C
MKTNQIYLVKDSFSLVLQIPAEVIGELFYKRLFEIAPEIRPIFDHTAIKEQYNQLSAMLAYIVKRLHILETIKDEIAKLTYHHLKYGIVEYRLNESVGEALLWTIEQGLGSHWNKEVKTAWAVCYLMFSNAMIEACEAIEV